MLRTLLLCTIFAASLTAQQFGKVQLWDVMENGKTQKIKGSLEFSSDGLSFTGKKGKNVSFAYADIECGTADWPISLDRSAATDDCENNLGNLCPCWNKLPDPLSVDEV